MCKKSNKSSEVYFILQIWLLYILMAVVGVMERVIVVLELVSTGGPIIQSKTFMNFVFTCCSALKCTCSRVILC